MKINVNKTISKAASYKRKGELDEARKLYEAVLHSYPNNIRAQEGLAGLNKPTQQQLDSLIALYNKRLWSDVVEEAHLLVTDFPSSFIVWNILGAAHKAIGQLERAENAFLRASAVNPNFSDAHNNLGVLLKDQGKLDAAIAAHERAMALKPDNADAYNNMGNALKDQGKLDAAIAAYEHALALKPDCADAYNNMGNALKDQGKLDAAIAAYERALALKPDNADAYNNMGVTLQEQGKLDAAIAAYERAMALKPHYGQANYNLGNILIVYGEAQRARSLFSTAVEKFPFDAKYRLAALCNTLPIVWNAAIEPNPLHAFDQSLVAFVNWACDDEAKVSLEENVGAVQPFRLAYYPENMATRLNEYGKAITLDKSFERLPSTSRADKNSIKIGIITSHLTNHSVFNVLLKGIITHLNREKFSIYLYAIDANQGSSIKLDTLNIKSIYQIKNTSQKYDLRKRILDDDLDFLLYPEIGMDPTTTWLAPQRLAPTQAATWGHPITTGLPNIDYFFSGELIESHTSSKHYSESLVKFPGTGCVTQWPNLVPRKSSWEENELPKDRITFIIPQTPFKFHPSNDVMILRVSKAVPNSIFLIPDNKEYPNATFKLLDRLKVLFAKHDVLFEGRFVVFPWLKSEEFLSLLHAADIYLDLPSFSGYTTAWQGINCGLPIVTLEGDFMRQRLAAGLLRKIGLSETIANSIEEFVDITQKLVEKRSRKETWFQYRDHIKALSPLADNDLSVIIALEKFVSESVDKRRAVRIAV